MKERAKILAVATAVMTEEANALLRAKANGLNLLKWAATYFATREQQVADAFATVAKGRGTPPGDYAKQHCQAAVFAVETAVADGIEPEELADNWLTEGPHQIVSILA